MTRTSPVGVVVLALTSLIAVGCSAQTSAVFQALLNSPPASTPLEVDPGGQASDAVAAEPTWWAHPDGYAMFLPAGWLGVGMDATATEQLLEAVATEQPGVSDRLRDVLATTRARVSMVAVDHASGAVVPPLMVVLAQSTDGERPSQLKARVEELLGSLPGLRGLPVRTDERVNDARSVRFDYVIDDPDLGPQRVRSSLFRFGGQAYLVSFIAPEDEFESARAAFEEIAASLRFGI